MLPQNFWPCGLPVGKMMLLYIPDSAQGAPHKAGNLIVGQEVVAVALGAVAINMPAPSFQLCGPGDMTSHSRSSLQTGPTLQIQQCSKSN